jgi:hypothetical protein
MPVALGIAAVGGQLAPVVLVDDGCVVVVSPVEVEVVDFEEPFEQALSAIPAIRTASPTATTGHLIRMVPLFPVPRHSGTVRAAEPRPEATVGETCLVANRCSCRLDPVPRCS